MSKQMTARYDDCSTLDPPRPDRVAVFTHRGGQWQSTEWFDIDEAVALRDALTLALAGHTPEPEVRGYVVLRPDAAGETSIGYFVHPTAETAARAAEAITDAHVGVVTALPEG